MVGGNRTKVLNIYFVEDTAFRLKEYQKAVFYFIDRKEK